MRERTHSKGSRNTTFFSGILAKLLRNPFRAERLMRKLSNRRIKHQTSNWGMFHLTIQNAYRLSQVIFFCSRTDTFSFFLEWQMCVSGYGSQCVLSFSFGERKSSTSSQHTLPAFLINQHVHVQHIKCKAPLQNTVQLFNPSQGTLFLRGLDYEE